MNSEIIRTINYLSPDDPSRSVDYNFSQWALENFDRLTSEKVLSKIGEMIDNPDSGICLKFGKQWVQTNKNVIIEECKKIMTVGEESPTNPEPVVRESHIMNFKKFNSK